MIKAFATFFTASLLLVSCVSEQKRDNVATADTNAGKNAVSNTLEAAQNTSAAANVPRPESNSAAAKKECLNADTGKDAVLAAQTFPIDFEPFAGSCFVTSYNPDYPDPPMESHYAIYRSDKKIFDFPGQFNGATFGCWVDAVSFQDLNADTLKDVIVVGKCSTKGGPYNENMIYINTGRTFVTRPDGNIKISDFTNIKEIADFVQDNREIFFK